MSEYPFLPLSVDAYFRDTRHLSAAQHGAYLLLLMEAWQRPNSALPDDETILARLACMSASEWHDNKDVILAFWKHDARSKTYTQKRLLQTKDHVKRTSAKQASNAKSRWEKKKDTSHGNAKTDAKSMPESVPKASQTDASQSQSQSTDSTPLPPTSKSAPPAAAPSPPPQGGVKAKDDLFEWVAKRLHDLAAAGDHPVALESRISPIWQLVKKGYDFQTEIEPAIKALVAKTPKGEIRSWHYFVKAIERERSERPSAPPASTPEAPWPDRLATARQRKQWPKKWGPPPNQPGCEVPAELVRPDDGKGWTEWKVGEAA